MSHNKDHKPTGFVKWFLSWNGIALTVILAMVSYWLLTAHLEHLAVALPYLILIACPLLHIFGHRHGDRSSKDGET